MQMLNLSLQDEKFSEVLLKSVGAEKTQYIFSIFFCNNVSYVTETDLHDSR